MVAAHETSSPLPRNSYNPRISPDTLALTQALSSLIPVATRKAREESRRKDETEFQAGQAARLQATADQLNSTDALLASQSDPYRRGFMYAHGKAKGGELAAQMQTEWNQQKDQLVTPGQYVKWSAGFTAEALQGVDDPEFTQGFLEQVSRVDDQLRGRTIENNYINTQQQALDDINTAYRAELDSVVSTGGSLEDIHTTLQAMRDNQRGHQRDGV